MSSDPREHRGPYVFDTNVLVSALLFAQSRPRQAFDAALAQGSILTSLELLSELDAVLSRPKFNRYLLREERTRFLQAFIQQAVLIEVTEHIEVCRDPKDNMVLELAVSGGASHIVTGDADLLGLNPFHGIAIASPDAFVARIRPRL
jgi:putative PIN family toxin of toxin-antitoxin system